MNDVNNKKVIFLIKILPIQFYYIFSLDYDGLLIYKDNTNFIDNFLIFQCNFSTFFYPQKSFKIIENRILNTYCG